MAIAILEWPRDRNLRGGDMKSKTFALVAIVLVFTTGCSSSSTSGSNSIFPSSTNGDEEFASVIKEETGNFLSGADMMSCSMDLGFVPMFGWSESSSDCLRDIELMVFASQRIVNKFSAMTPSGELEPLVSVTIAALTPVANSNYESLCTVETVRDENQAVACTDARIQIQGDEDFVLKDVWDALDKWQPLF